ncbi:hypothetical protein Tco_1370328, partial [Tanacetum coccineum]
RSEGASTGRNGSQNKGTPTACMGFEQLETMLYVLISLFALMSLMYLKLAFRSFLRTQFKEFLASKGVYATDLLNQGWQQDFEYFTRCELSAYRHELLENLYTLGAMKSYEHQIKSSVKMQSQEIQIKPVQAMDDSLIVSKGSLIA